MNTTLTAVIVFGCLIGTVLLGRILRRLLPEDHLSADSRDAVKLAMGLGDYGGPGLGVAGELGQGLLRHRTKRSDPDGREGRVPRPAVGHLRTGSRRCPRAASR